MTIDLAKMSHEDLLKLVPTLLSKLEQAQKASERSLSFKVSDKGALSVYGMGRFPVTLYKSQWRRLFAVQKDLAAFIQTNDHLLKDKGDE